MRRKEPKGAVISVRISAGEQAELRRRAKERGLSVSELLRSAALGLVDKTKPWPSSGTTTGRFGDLAIIWTKLPPGCYADGSGIVWDAPVGARVEGSTLTL